LLLLTGTDFIKVSLRNLDDGLLTEIAVDIECRCRPIHSLRRMYARRGLWCCKTIL